MNRKDDPEFFDIYRKAHRVFLDRKGADRFNPFRHIPWVSVSADPKDLESGGQIILKEPFTIKNQLQRTILTSWINVFLICAPIGLYFSFKGESTESFILNYIAEFPLWFMCDYALEELEWYIGPTASDLLDIFTNNTVQVISSFLLLKAKKVSLLQTSLIGGILNNILMLLGLSFFIGGISRGIRNHEQRFNRLGAQGSSTLLSIAATSLLIPTAVKQLNQTTEDNLVLQSRGVAIVLLFVYITYTFCQMVTHKKLYMSSGKSRGETADHQDSAARSSDSSSLAYTSSREHPHRSDTTHDELVMAVMTSPGTVLQEETVKDPEAPKVTEDMMASKQTDNENARESTSGGGEAVMQTTKENNSTKYADCTRRILEIKGPHLHFVVAAFLFVVTIVLLFFCIDGTVQSISALMDDKGLTETFVGLMLLPIPNCDFAPISLAIDDSLEQTMKYTVGRSIQTALLVEPMVVLIAWWTAVAQVTLAFDGFEVVSLFTTILLLNFLVIDAKVHWVHGVLLLSDWVLIGIAAYFVTPEPSSP